MCRSIKTLYNYEPPATDDEVRAAALQYVRKVSGYRTPSKANTETFELAVDQIAAATRALIRELVTSAAPRDRQVEATGARDRAAARHGRRPT